MKMMKTLAAIPLLLFSTGAMAQSVKVTKGDFTALKSEKTVDVDFVYSDMIVGKDLTNDQYIEKKTKEYNEKEPGRGDTWAASWVSDRERLFHPKFFELYNKVLEGTQTASQEDGSAKYRLIVHTTRTEPGFNVGVMSRPAGIDVKIQLVEVSDPGKILGEMTMVNCPGANAMGFDYDTGGRIAEAYAKMGKELASFLRKKAFK